MAINLGDLVFRIRAESDGLGDDARKQAKQATDGISKDFAKVGTNLTKTVTLPLVALGTAAVKEFQGVNKGLREVVTLTGEAGSQADATFSEFQSGVQGLSNDLGLAQSELVDGLYQSLSAGVPRENAFTFLQDAAELGIAGVATTEEAVSGITAAINGFGLSFEDSSRVADVLFSTVKNGTTTMSQLSAVIGQVAQPAALAGASFEETSAALATLSNTTGNVNIAATQIRAAFTALTRPSEELTEIFNALGFESAQAAIQQEGFSFAMQAVSDAAGGSSGRLTELLGSQEAVGAVSTLAGPQLETFTANIDAMGNAAGAAGRAFDEIDKARNFDRLIVQFQNLGLQIGETLLPIAEGVASAVGGILSVVGEIPAGVLTAFGGIAATVGPALIAFSKLQGAVGGIKSAFASLGTVNPAFLGIGAAIAVATAAFVTWRKEVAAAQDRAEAYGEAVDRTSARNTNFADVLTGQVNPALEQTASALEAATPEGAGLLAVFDELGRSDTVNTLTDLGLSVDQIAAGAVNGREAFQELNLGFELFGQNIADAGADALVDQLNQIAETTADENVSELATTLALLGENIPQQEFIALLEGIDDVGQAAVDDAERVNGFAMAAIEAGVAAGQWTQAQADLALATQDTGANLDFALDAANSLRDGLLGVGEITPDFVAQMAVVPEGTAPAAEGLTQMADEANRTGEELNEITSAVSGMVDALFASLDAEIAFEAGLDKLTAAAQKTKEEVGGMSNAFDISTESGRANTQVILGLADNALQKAQVAFNESGGSADVFAQSLANSKAEILSQAEAAGFSRAQVEALLGPLDNATAAMYGLADGAAAVPGEVKVFVDVDTGQATINLQGISDFLASLDGRVSTATVQITETYVAADAGSLDAFHTGGQPELGTSFLVGETGTELARYSPNGDLTIFSPNSPQTQQALGDRDGGTVINQENHIYEATEDPTSAITRNLMMVL